MSNSHGKDLTPVFKRGRMQAQPILSFFNEDKTRIHQPYDDALVVTIQIEGYDVRKVLVD